MPRLPTALIPGLVPGQTVSLLDRARLAIEDGRFDEATRLLANVQSVDPLNPGAIRELGRIAFRRGDLTEGLRQFRLLLKMRPNEPEDWKLFGLVLEQAGEFQEALVCYEKIASLRPFDFADRLQYANLLYHRGKFAEAAAAFEPLVERDRRTASGFGASLIWSGRVREGLDVLDREIAMPGSDGYASLVKGSFLLTLGNLPTGFALFEGRWQQKAPEGKRKSSRPIWLGEPPIAGKTLYVHWEQGFGDTIQFARYVPMAARAGARVILEVRRQTLDLMASLDGVSCLIEDGDPMPDHDFYCPVVSLPLAFGTTLETIPADVPYLRADPVAVAAWRERLAGIAGKKVGLVFAGSSRKGIDPSAMAADKRRSIALADLAPLAAVPNCAFFSLQFGPPAEQTANPPAGMTLYDYTPELGNFSDAALIENLDLVISVDTATAHLAGALAKPVWLLNKFDTDWRWLLDREDSPWYPTMRIFRQPTPGDWDTPIARVAEELRRFAAA